MREDEGIVEGDLAGGGLWREVREGRHGMGGAGRKEGISEEGYLYARAIGSCDLTGMAAGLNFVITC